MMGLALGVTLIAVLLFVFLATERPSLDRLWGDEGTYVAMTASLARDFDLAFEETDRTWALRRDPDRGVAVILQRTARGITYSKPLLYPLLAAPAYKIFGESGLLLLNVLGLAAGLLLGWVYLERIAGGGHGSLMLAVLVCTGAVLPYLVWRMSESLQTGLALAGTVLVCGALGRPCASSSGRWSHWIEGRWAVPVGGALLGLLISMRLSNAALAGGAVLSCIFMRRWRRAAEAAVGTAAALAAVLLLTQLALGTVSPYTAERSSFNADIGYPTGVDTGESAAAAERFEERPATHRLGLSLTSSTLYSTFYFFVGRHTGLLAYFPLALVMLWLLARQRDRLGAGLVSGVLALVLFYLLYMPNNYFGGSTFVGNRYFLVAYPVLMVGLRRLPSPRTLVAVAVLGLAFGLSAALSVHRTRELTDTSQSHTAAGLFRLLPYESTAIDIHGQRARFWSRDYVRFTDPYARVGTGHFELRTDRPPTELMIASRLGRDVMHFLVRTKNGDAFLEWRDWRSSGQVELVSSTAGAGIALPITVQPARPWRRHRFWFRNDETYDVRLISLALREGSGGPDAADVYYLGDGSRLEQGFELSVLKVSVPAIAIAGASDRVSVRVRNDSDVAWLQRAVLPVVLGYRIERGDLEWVTHRQPLDSDIAAGEETDLELKIEWPGTPGDYRLIVDLALHPVAWFEERTGEPLISRIVTVKSPAHSAKTPD